MKNRIEEKWRNVKKTLFSSLKLDNWRVPWERRTDQNSSLPAWVAFWRREARTLWGCQPLGELSAGLPTAEINKLIQYYYFKYIQRNTIQMVWKVLASYQQGCQQLNFYHIWWPMTRRHANYSYRGINRDAKSWNKTIKITILLYFIREATKKFLH